MTSYIIGSGNNPISLTVAVTSAGTATTGASVIAGPPNYGSTTVAGSKDTLGNIMPTQIGIAVELKGKTLGINTKIVLKGPDVASRKADFDGISAVYTLDGGTDGNKAFPGPAKKNDMSNGKFTNVELFQTIELS